MKNKRFYLIIASILLVSIVFFAWNVYTNKSTSFQTSTVTAKSISSQISAPGTIHSENEATLHFQTAGKVVALPYKVGDSVYQGATIAQLDTYALQRQLSAALNTYRSTRDNFDQTVQNSQGQNVLLNEQQKSLTTAGSGVGPYGTDAGSTNYINDLVKRILDQNQATLDNSVINVELTNYALQLSTLSSPINGVITAEDITVPNVNVTTATAFSVADPTAPVFKAHVSESDIDYIHVGAKATITLSGSTKVLQASVSRIEPQKINDTTGNYYIVDVTSDGLSSGKLGQSGNVLISNTLSGQHLLIPRWTIVGHNNVWVLKNAKPELVHVSVGKVHGQNIEILSGLTTDDKVLTNPESLAKSKYSVL